MEKSTNVRREMSTLFLPRIQASDEVTEGTGVGSTRDPRGMLWSSAAGAALYFADTGNHEVQKYASTTRSSCCGSLKHCVCRRAPASRLANGCARRLPVDQRC